MCKRCEEFWKEVMRTGQAIAPCCPEREKQRKQEREKEKQIQQEKIRLSNIDFLDFSMLYRDEVCP